MHVTTYTSDSTKYRALIGHATERNTRQQSQANSSSSQALGLTVNSCAAPSQIQGPRARTKPEDKGEA